ncbi:hypothetical protein [Micromonospora sp. NPDC047730]|uniref:hypothetical protein n=1 Tax=Micromonospora sp. NPDC047730 TaxID=3364253 RepID=UPI003712CBCC
MGSYCRFCDRRCFVLRVLRDGRSMALATCARGMAHDRQKCGQDHTTALNPATDQAAIQRLLAEIAELKELARSATNPT